MNDLERPGFTLCPSTLTIHDLDLRENERLLDIIPGKILKHLNDLERLSFFHFSTLTLDGLDPLTKGGSLTQRMLSQKRVPKWAV